MIKEKDDETSKDENISESPTSYESQSSSTRPTPVSSPDPKFLHYGDIIQIFSEPISEKEQGQSVKIDLNEKTFFVDYIDDQKIRLIQTTTNDTILLYIDENGQLQEPSIRRIELLTRAKEPGFARQKGLLPEQWVDIYFIGLEQPITGKITHLEEDQIELTLHPDHEVIYIDFSYRGIPEDLAIEKFVLRSSPPSTSTISQEEETEQDAENSAEKASIEFTPENEAIIRLPEKFDYDPSIDEILENEYIEADEIIFGKDREVVEQFLEQTQHEMVFSIETQLTSMMNELLSTIPNAQRTHEIMTDVHRILDRFKELREQFSLMDDYTHQIQGFLLHGLQYQPMVDYLIAGTGAPLSWMLPVTQTRRKMYYLPDESADDFEEVGDTVLQPHDIRDLYDLSEQYRENTLQGDSNPYKKWMEEVYPAFSPLIDTPLTTNDGLVARSSVLFSPQLLHESWESIVENSVGGFSFGATAVTASAKYTTLKPVHNFFQRFSTGIPFLERSEDNRRKFLPQFLTSNETAHIQSWILLPESVAKFSAIQLPTLDMLQRSEMSQKYWLKYRTFPSNGKFQPDTLLLDKLDKKKYNKNAPKDTKDPIQHFLTGIQHVVLDPVLVRNQHELPEELYRKYLQTMIPSTFDLVERVQSWMKPTQGLNIGEQMQVLAPFLVRLSSLSYPHYNRMRYFMKERTTAYKKQFHELRDQYRKINDTYTHMNQILGKGVLGPSEYNLGRKLLEQSTLYQIFHDVYRIRGLMSGGDGVSAFRPISSSELLYEVFSKDTATLLTALLRNATLNHVVSDSFLKASAETDWEEYESKSSLSESNGGDCRRNFLVKRYTSLADLQKDNYNDDVFYDKNMDDTPYELLDEYKKEMPEKTEDMESEDMRDFLDLLSTNLIKKHACPKESAAELAITLVAKKKRVKNGEYAMLELPPSKAIDISTEPTITHREFFKRVQNKWVQDNTLSDESFADLSFLIQSAFPNKRGAVNRMLCDSQPSCMKNPKTSTCDPMESSEKRIQIMRQEYAVKEMEKRLEISQEDLSKLLEKLILDSSRTLAAKERLRTVWLQHYSLMAYAMGQMGDKDAPPIIVSPYTQLRDDIIGQDDFTKKQYDLVRFFQKGFLRRAMIDELGEDDHWFYCTETNTKLLPVFMYDLAKEFIAHGEVGYRERLETYKQFQMISDDGDAIVDKHSGYILSKLEWVNEEMYDDQGFKIQTGSVLEIDPEEGNMEQKSETLGMDWTEGNRSSASWIRDVNAIDQEDSETVIMVKNIFATFCQLLHLDAKEYEKGGFRAFVQRVSLEWIEQSVMTKDVFIREMSKKSSSSTTTNMTTQYQKYYHQYVVIITTAIFLIGIQTTTPAIRTKKTVPGCVKSFTGYPLTESMEDQTGIQYMTCMLNLIKSSIAPWNSIQSIKKEIIQEKLRDTIQNMLNSRKDLYELYLRQRQYWEDHPEEFEIPEEHQLQKWRTLLPPAVPIDIVSKLSRELPPINEKDTIISESHIIRYGYGITETINSVVQKQDVLLKTSMGIPFVQNACCDERPAIERESTLQYFVRESPVLQTFMNHVKVLQTHMDLFRRKTTAVSMVYSDDTRLKRPEVTSGNQEEIIYSAFIYYCNYDRLETDIPLFLQGICSTKPATETYRNKGTIKEKIQDLKEAGRNFRWEDFEQLLRLVSSENRIKTDFTFIQPSAVKVLTEFMAQSTEQESTAEDPFLDPIRTPLLDVLVKYDPQIMLLDDSTGSLGADDGEGMHRALDSLMNVLGPLNQTRKERILRFLPKGAERTRAERTLDSWTSWSPSSGQRAAVPNRLQQLTSEGALHPDKFGDEELYEMSQFVKNSVVFMVKILPPMMFNNQFVKEWNVPKHWGLTDTHQGVIVKFLQQTHSWFAKFSKSDPRFFTLLREWQAGLLPLVQFTQLLPIQLPIHKDGKTYFRLFPKEIIHQWMKYVSLSVLDHLVLLCQKMPNVMGTKIVKDTAAKWMMALLDMFGEDKEIVDMSYEKIMKKVKKSRDEEKTRVMNEFRNVNNTDRRYMYMEKMFKLNRWNVESKDVFKYNGKQFDKELAEFTDDALDDEFPDEPMEEGYEENEYEGNEEGYDMDDENDDYGTFNYDGDDN